VLAGKVAGEIVARHPESVPALDEWAVDREMWVRRAALLAMLTAARDRAMPDRFWRYADAMFDERELFIRKAIGWVLREYGRRDPDAVCAWLRPRAARASGVTLREAVKYLAPEQRAELLGRRA
jgi:3-methyladenine DNA glycosylase AlkD